MSRDCNNGFDEWGGYMDAKITKLEEQFSAASDPFRQSNLFAGISIYVNGRTDPSADELKRIMMVHGGTFHHYERAHTTYIIASNLPDVKVRNMNTSKIIKPQWVVDCLSEKRILDYTRYLLYTNKKTTQPSITFSLKKKAESPPPSAEELASDVSSIMQELEELNAKIRQSLGGANGEKEKLGKEVPALEEIPELEEVECKSLQPILNGSHSSTSNASKSSVARTAVDPKFLSEFYNNSRLHHIATLGAGFKQYVNELRQKKVDELFPARAQLREKLLARNLCNSTVKISNCVMHIDMDCFFVSVGLRKHPHLRGQPVAVTHSKGGAAATDVPVHPEADRKAEMELFANRFEEHSHNNVLSDKVRQGFESKMSLSEIASCSYEARAKGLRNGMFVGQALKLCPELKTIPYDFEGYREVAFTLYDTIAQYTINIEAVSCDEMFVELSDVLNELGVTAMTFVAAVREEVREKTGCPCSAGVGANKLQARMATKRAKPDGQFELVEQDVEAYMADIALSDLPGVGSSIAHTLKEANLLKCSDLQKVSVMRLQILVGKKLGETLQQFSRGIDKRPLVYGQIRKSVSAEVNYGIRFKEYAELEPFLHQLCNEVHSRLTDIQRKTKCITLKIMVRAKDAPIEASKFMGHGVCDNVTKSVSLSEYTDDLETITRTVITTIKSLSLTLSDLRGLGIQLTKLDDPKEGKEKKENIIKNMFDKIAEKKQLKDKPTDRRESKATEKEIRPREEDVVTATKSSSPVKPWKRTRGRPPTSSLGNSIKESKIRANDIDVLDMLHTAAAKKSEALAIPITNSQCPPDVDPSVFAELPHDIRVEILLEHARQNKPSTSDTKNSVNVTSTSTSATATPATATATATAAAAAYELNESDLRPSTSKAAQERLERKRKPEVEQKTDVVDQEFLQALPPDIRAEIESQLKAEQLLKSLNTLPDFSTFQELGVVPSRPPDDIFGDIDTLQTPAANVSIDNIFSQPKCLELLLEWVQSFDAPEQYDVYLVCIHAQEFVHSKRIDELYEPLMYLCRVINSLKSDSNDCSWHAAYKQIVEAVQLEMRAVYGGRQLFLGAKLKCDKCCVV